MVKYGLAIKGTDEPLEFRTESQEGEFCNDVVVTLERSGDGVWLVDTQEEAEHARDTKPEWYSSGYSTPIRDTSWELEVIMVDLKIFKL